MPVNTKTVKKRIKSVKNTQKMTRAMEMVSAAKMRKSVTATLNTRLYATLAQELMKRLSNLVDPAYPLLQVRPVKNVLVVLVSSNRGLCGSYNANLFKSVHAILNDKKLIGHHRNGKVHDDEEVSEQPHISVIGIGKKSALYAKKHKYELVGVYDDFTEQPQFEEVVPIAKQAVEEYKTGKYDRIVVAFTHFESALKQIVKVRQVLPISEKDLARMLKEDAGDEDSNEEFPIESYLFEPDMEAIVDYVFPKLVEIQMYQALTDAAASEHSSRMIAMKNASENAGEMVKSLTLAYNKARQAAITQEISEIVGGAAALE